MGKDEKFALETITEVVGDDMQRQDSELEAFIMNSDRSEPHVSRLRLICLTCGLGG